MDDGVDTRALSPGDLVSIRTLNSVYNLRLDEPARGRGVATGDSEFINKEARASLIGATLTGRGSMVKVGLGPAWLQGSPVDSGRRVAHVEGRRVSRSTASR